MNKFLVFGCMGFVLAVGLIWGEKANANDVVADQTAASFPVEIVLVGMESCCEQNAWLEAENAIIAEFFIIGVNVVRIPGAAKDITQQLEELNAFSKERNAAGAVRVIKKSDENAFAVDLWLADRVTQKTILKKIELALRSTEDPALVLAVRTVELFRASLQEIRMVDAKETSLSNNPEIQDIVNQTLMVSLEKEKSNLVFSVNTLGYVSGTSGSVGVTGGIGGVVGIEIFDTVKFSLEAALFLWRKDIETAGFRSELNDYRFRAAVLFSVLKYRSFRLRIGMGGGVLLASISGKSATDYYLNQTREAVGYLGGSPVAEFSLSKRFGVTAGFWAGCVLSQIQIFHGGVHAADVGQFILEGNVGLVFNLF